MGFGHCSCINLVSMKSKPFLWGLARIDSFTSWCFLVKVADWESSMISVGGRAGQRAGSTEFNWFLIWWPKKLIQCGIPKKYGRPTWTISIKHHHHHQPSVVISRLNSGYQWILTILGAWLAANHCHATWKLRVFSHRVGDIPLSKTQLRIAVRSNKKQWWSPTQVYTFL